jgi:hypothetical protein
VARIKTTDANGPRAWIYKDAHQLKKHGEDVSWYVGWIDASGRRRCKSCGPGESGFNAAERLKQEVENQLREVGVARPPRYV